MAWEDRREFSSLVGKTLKSVQVGDDVITFESEDGKEYRMFHDQDCCENVSVEDVNGDVQDLVGSPILFAEENSSTDWPEGKPKPDYEDESFTWTFYRIGTIKGTVVIRWYGSSNGYYSERVDFEEVA